MTREYILGNYPQIKTITQIAKHFIKDQFTHDKISVIDMFNTKLDNKNDFNFVVWRSRKNMYGEILYEGAFMATYSKEDALFLARSLNIKYTDNYSVRKVA